MFAVFALCVAHAQSVEIESRDEGATVSLLDQGASCVVDPLSAVDLDQIYLQTPTYDLTFGSVVDAALDVAADPDDLMVLSLDDQDDLNVSFATVEGTSTGGRVCKALYEYRCFTIARIRFCSMVEIGTTCCDDGTRSCGDYILFPGED
ncbi:MAG: hypothetical protein ABMB14_23560 [Myxococcota bacterium]